MSFLRFLSSFVFLFLAVFDYGIPIQRNLYLTKWVGSHVGDTVTQHNCLLVNHWENQKDDIYEITRYCISEWPSKWKIQENNVDKSFTFAQLSALNITSEQLYLWSAPMDIVEDYQVYLNQLSILNNSSLSKESFYNCTWPRFGPTCQYSFDEDESYHYSSLVNIIYDFYLRDEQKQMNQSCYIHLQCNLGLTLLCISWTDICDGIVQCINGTDEEQCHPLEINECNEDEFRCKNGQCIPLSFLNDKIGGPDCLDGSDEFFYSPTDISWNSVGPLFKLEETLCLKWPGIGSPYNIGRIYSCSGPWFFMTSNELNFFVDKPNNISEVCWSALNCYLQFMKSLNYFYCTDICQGETCKKIIANECPDMFFIPNSPIAFGHIYFAYTKEYIINQTTFSNIPEYVCYNEQLCGGFYSNRTLISFKSTTCRRRQDFPLEFVEPHGKGITSLYQCLRSIRDRLHKCNTILQRDSSFCDNSTMYQCINSSKCIGQIRLLDHKQDCDYKDDEIWNLTDHICPIKSARIHVNCTSKNLCFSRKLFADGTCDCRSAVNDVCEDEPSLLNTIKIHISFPDICDNYIHLKAILINGTYETDETDCEQWPCNNIYTRCNGIFNCLNGTDELDCHPPSLINCSIRSYVCFSLKTYDYVCLSADKLNDGIVDCLSGIDESKICRNSELLLFRPECFCNITSQSIFLSHSNLCDNHSDCFHGEDEKFCHHIKRPDFFSDISICTNEYDWIRSDVEQFLCIQFFISFNRTKAKYFSLGRMGKPVQHITKHNIHMGLTSLSINQIIPQNEHYCHRHPSLRVWLKNNDKNLTRMTCFCPPSHYGDQCQYQNQRVSLTIQFRAFSDSWQTLFIVVISLVDDSNERTIHSHEQLTYLPVPNCKTKYNIDLLYAIRPKNQSRNYLVHIDIYEKLKLSYRGSLLMPLSFPFLPVQRVSVQLNIPHTHHNSKNCSYHECKHGECIRYFDDPKHSTFCQCSPEWSGRYCNISHPCTCSSDSLCIGKLANNRSLCVCPVYKWGPRCLLHDTICQSNKTCDNDGQCIPLDRNIASSKQFVCICPEGFFGDRCEISQNKIILSFESDIILPQSMLIHFIEVKPHEPPENGTTFKIIPIDRSPVTIYWSRLFHIAFLEFIPQDYYLIVVKNLNDQSKINETTLKSSNRCPNISAIVNETLAQFHLIRRIKYYHLICQQHAPHLSCFYDELHVCLCTDFENQRQANCFEFDHKLQRNCRGQSNCQNGAECLQDSVNCPQTSICRCPSCFYGELCQFSLSGFSLSLDAILGDHIQPHVNIRYQPVIIQVSVTLTVLITAMGLLNGILSMMTFMNKEPRKTGCGLYLLGSSITTLIVSIIFCVKFWILLTAQMTYMTNQSFLLFQCRSIDFILRTGLFMDQWLNSCVAIERAFMAIRGISFNKTKSKNIAKFIIPVLFLLTIGSNIPEIIYRHLLDDNSNDENRIWCILEYSSNIQLYNLIMNIFHFCTPFIINLLSAIIIIIKTARLRTTAKTEKNYRKVLLEQFLQHKHLLISPLILIILAIPRLIISFVAGCMKSYADTWLFLIGYFISFIPPVVIFLIFVVPSKAYKEEFVNTVRRYQRTIRTRFRLFN